MANPKLQYYTEDRFNGIRSLYVGRYGIEFQYLLLIPFFVNPLITIVFLTIHLIKQKEKNETLLYLLYFLISIYLGLINTTKVPVSDLLMYKRSFDLASDMNLFDYLSLFTKEIVFYIATYLSNKLFFGNFKLYVILFTFLQYYLVFISIHKYWKTNDKNLLIFSIIIFALLSRYFFASAHLVRQILACSIFVYFFTTRIVDKKTYWWLIPIAILVHSSSLLLFLLSFIPKIREKLSVKNGIIIAFVIIGCAIFGNHVIDFLYNLTRGIKILNYPFQRFHSMEMMDYSWYTGDSAGSLRYWYYAQLLPVIFFAYFFIKGKSEIYSILNLSIFIFLVLETFVFSGLLYMQMRMAYYLFFVIPFVYPLLFIKNRLYDHKTFDLLGMAFILSWFIYRLINGFHSGALEFAPLTEIIINPIPLYFYMN